MLMKSVRTYRPIAHEAHAYICVAYRQQKSWAYQISVYILCFVLFYFFVFAFIFISRWFGRSIMSNTCIFAYTYSVDDWLLSHNCSYRDFRRFSTDIHRITSNTERYGSD